LATVTSDKENEFLYDHFGKDHVCWLGATDEEHEGHWSWVTGEPWQYKNWFNGEPNNVDGAENWAVFGGTLPIDVDGGSYFFDFGSKWADFNNEGLFHGVFIAHAICEWDARDPNQRDPSQPQRPTDPGDQPPSSP